MIFYLNPLGKRFKRLAKTKSPNGNDCCFAHLGTEFESSSAFALHCSGGGVDEMELGKTSKVTVNFFFGKGFE